MLSCEASEVLEAADVEGLSAVLSEVRFDLCQRFGVDQQIVRSHANKFSRAKEKRKETREVLHVNLQRRCYLADNGRGQAR